MAVLCHILAEQGTYVLFLSKTQQITGSAGHTALISSGQLGNSLSQSYSPTFKQASSESRMFPTHFFVDQSHQMALVKTPTVSYQQQLFFTFPTPHF